MTIAELREKCKTAVARVPRDVRVLILLVLVAFLCFGLGYLAGFDAAGQGMGVSVGTSPLATSSEARVVASRSGTKYYFPWCSGAARIADTNKVWFSSVAAAETQGYTPAKGCGGP